MKTRIPQFSVGLGFISPLDPQDCSEVFRALEHAGVKRVSVGSSSGKVQALLRKKSLSPFGVELIGVDGLGAALKMRPDWVLLDLAARAVPLRALERALSTLKAARVRTVLRVDTTAQALEQVVRSQELRFDEVQFAVPRSLNAAQKKRLTQLALRTRQKGVDVSVVGDLGVEELRELAPLDVFDVFHVDLALGRRALVVGVERASREFLSAVQAP